MSHDHDRHQAHEEKSGCCGGKREARDQSTQRPEPAKPASEKRGCCG